MVAERRGVDSFSENWLEHPVHDLRCAAVWGDEFPHFVGHVSLRHGFVVFAFLDLFRRPPETVVVALACSLCWVVVQVVLLVPRGRYLP